jgi:hypothetical protein
MNKLPSWQKPIAWAVIALAFPFVCLWSCYVAAKWRVWAGNVLLPKSKAELYPHGER